MREIRYVFFIFITIFSANIHSMRPDSTTSFWAHTPFPDFYYQYLAFFTANNKGFVPYLQPLRPGPTINPFKDLKPVPPAPVKKSMHNKKHPTPSRVFLARIPPFKNLKPVPTSSLPPLKKSVPAQEYLGSKQSFLKISNEGYLEAFTDHQNINLEIKKALIHATLAQKEIRSARKKYLEYTVHGASIARLIYQKGIDDLGLLPTLLIATLSIRFSKKGPLETYNVYLKDVKAIFSKKNRKKAV